MRGHQIGHQGFGQADEQLTGAVDQLLADTALRARMDAIGADIRTRSGVARSAEALASVA